jgi:hypothetical protein
MFYAKLASYKVHNEVLIDKSYNRRIYDDLH